jgi:hypothetical protein
MSPYLGENAIADMLPYLGERAAELVDELPEPPLVPTDECFCAILIFVAKEKHSQLIDKFSGGYGYSHVAIDCCEREKRTGKKVIIEATKCERSQSTISRSL